MLRVRLIPEFSRVYTVADPPLTVKRSTRQSSTIRGNPSMVSGLVHRDCTLRSGSSTANGQLAGNWMSSGANAIREIAGRTPFIVDLFLIFASFALAIGVVSLLGSLGFPFGFDVFPFGEDNNWVEMLRRGGSSGAAQLAWQLDHRNPLSAWWYVAARSLILNFEQGLLWLRYMMAAALALCTYAMVATVGRSRSFALGLAMVTIFWMANRFTEQIIWNFQAALCASLLSVAAYAQFVNGRRRSYFL